MPCLMAWVLFKRCFYVIVKDEVVHIIKDPVGATIRIGA